MKQASSFRLPVLKLQPKESQFSLSYGDNNQSSCSMIKYQSSPLRNYDPSPIKKRVRGMTIAIYNSQEKLKTAEFRYGGDFITQQVQEVNKSEVNTVRRYRSKLKHLMSSKDELQGLSRDPRIYSFKEPAATIRLDRLNIERNDQQLQEKVRELMGKVKLLLSTQQFYQQPQKQETFQVTMVRLRDEYDCLYQDFNDYYVQNKKLDNQVLQLLNHMEIINKLLKPKRPMMIRKESIIFDDLPSEVPEVLTPNLPSPEIQQPIQPPPPPEPILEPAPSISEQEPREESVFTPLTSIQLNEEIPPSDLELQDSPQSPKKRRQKAKRSPQKSQKSIMLLPSVKDISVLEINQVSEVKQITSRSKTVSEDIPLKSIRSTQSEQQPPEQKEEETPPISDRPPLKRTSSNMGSCNKRRNTVLENKQNRRQTKGATTISELEDSQMDEEENQQEQETNEIVDVTPTLSEIPIHQTLLDLLIQCENIYRYPYYQTWEFHIESILAGSEFGEYDL